MSRRRYRRIATVSLAIGLCTSLPSTAQQGNWDITNGSIGSFAGWATVSGVKSLVGDFNGDGRDDVALLRQDTGWSTMPVALASGSGGWTIANNGIGSFATWARQSGVLPLVGDFNGDGRDDVALLREENGWSTMPIAFANGSGGWTITNSAIGNFASWARASGVKPIVGDFNGDNRDDVALLRRHAGWGSVPIAFATGSGAWNVTNGSVGSFATWARTDGVVPLVGDYNGDNRDDIALVRQTPGWGTVPIALATGAGSWNITNKAVGSFAGWATRYGVKPIVGDFDGNGRDDIALLRQAPGWGTVPVAHASGSGNWSISNGGVGSFANWAATHGVEPIVGDYDNDGRDDIALLRRTPGWGTMPVAFSTGSGNWTITNQTIGNFSGWAATHGVQTLAGDFTGDGLGDVALLRRWPGWGTMPVAGASNRPANTQRPLTVARHSNSTATNADADAILSDANNVLQTNDGAGDTATPVAFVRSGNMTVFNNTDGVLNTSSELSTVFGLAPDMKIVPAVDYCGGQFNTSYIGCGIIGSFNLIIERFLASQEGILWAHEIGHNVGLSHRTDTTNALMYPSIGSNRLRVNAAESMAFLSGGLPVMAGLSAADQFATMAPIDGVNDEMGLSQDIVDALRVDTMMQAEPDPTMQTAGTLSAALDSGAALERMSVFKPDPSMGLTDDVLTSLKGDPMMLETSGPAELIQVAQSEGSDGHAHQDDRPLEPVGDFVRQIHLPAMNLQTAAKYGADDVPSLIEIINNPEEVVYHENAALVLGMIGVPLAVETLISYLENPEAIASPDPNVDFSSKGKAAATVALGYAANLGGSESAVDYLIARTSSSALAEFGQQETVILSEYAIIALGFSGSDRALQHLGSLKGSAEIVAADEPQGQMSGMVDASLEISREISEKGLLEYYAPVE